MDAELNAKHSTESAPGALKRGVRALHKGSPPKPPPSRPRGDGCASTNEAECQSEAKDGQMVRIPGAPPESTWHLDTWHTYGIEKM